MIKYAAITNQGDREYNEDYLEYIEINNKLCFVLADGLGGHGGGDIASKLVVKSILNEFKYIDYVDSNKLLKLIDNAQEELLFEQRKTDNVDKMKTTCVVLYIDDRKTMWTHIGDSRLYRFRGKNYIQTNDHSVPWMLYKSGEIANKDIRGHQERNKLYSVMGVEYSEIPCKVQEHKVHRGDAILMCSDGFWEYIDEETMQIELNRAKSPKEWLLNMEHIVLKNGRDSNMDNYSAIGIFFDK